LLSLYDKALPEVYGYLLARCGTPAVAEDLTAETFLAAVDAVRRDRPPQITTGWLVGVARHKLADHWRQGSSPSSRRNTAWHSR
jgi:RNA polymerase sigma-70 factor (ECF subfamily)